MAIIPSGQSNTFEGGMDKDIAPELLPKNKYRDSQNLRLVSLDGNKYKLENIRGSVGYFEIPDIYPQAGKSQVVHLKLTKTKDFPVNGFVVIKIELKNDDGDNEFVLVALKDDETIAKWYENIIYNFLGLSGFSAKKSIVNQEDVLEITHSKIIPFDFSFIIDVNESAVLIETEIAQRAVAKLTFQLGSEFIIIGMVNVGNGIVVFSTNRKYSDSIESGNQIGLVDENGIYKTIVASPELNFSADAHIEGRFRIKFGDHRLVYFRDKYNALRVVDIDDEFWVDTNPGFINEHLSIFQSIDIPNITYNGFIQGGSVLTGGYVFAIRYITESLNNTKWLSTTNLIEVVSKIDSNDGSYRGDPDNTLSNKSIVLDITGIDLDYKYFEVAACKALSETGNNFACKIFIRQDITAESTQITYTGLEPGETISQSDIALLGVNFNHVNSGEILKDRLFVANIKRDSVLLDWDLSGINIDFVIKEHGDLKGGELEKKDYFEKGYMPDEHYAFSVVPFDLNGNPMFAIPFGKTVDENTLGTKRIKIPSLSEFGLNNVEKIIGGKPIIDGIDRFASVGIKLSNINIPDDIKSKISGFSVYRALREEKNKQVIGYGVMSETYYIPEIELGVSQNGLYDGWRLDGLGFRGLNFDNANFDIFTFDCPEFMINKFSGFVEGDELKLQILYGVYKRNDVDFSGFYNYFRPDLITPKNGTIAKAEEILPGRKTSIAGASFFNEAFSAVQGQPIKTSDGCTTVIIDLKKSLYSGTFPHYVIVSLGDKDFYKAQSYLASYYRFNPQQYGREENIVYYPTGHFFKVDSNTPNTIPPQEIFGGDCFSENFIYRKKITNPAYQATLGELRQFPMLSTINLKILHTETGAYPYSTLDSMSSDGGAKDDSDNNLLYNNAYSSHDTLQFAKTKPKIIDKVKEITKFPCSIFYSDSDINQSLVDRFRIFLPNNFQDRYNEFGEITHLEAINGDIVCFHRRGLRRLNVFREVISPGDEISFKIGSGEVLSRESTILSHIYGCQNKKAIAKSNNWIYFPDCLAGKFFRTNGGQLETISEKGMNGFFEDAGLENIAGIEEVMYGYFDFKYKEYVLTTNFFGGEKIKTKLLQFHPEITPDSPYMPGDLILEFSGAIPDKILQSKKVLLKGSLNLDNIYTIFVDKNLPYTGQIRIMGKKAQKSFIQNVSVEDVFLIPENPKTISFNEALGAWETVFSYHPFLTYSDTDKVITVPHRNENLNLYPNILLQNKAWVHDVDKLNYNRFYGKLFSDESFVEYVLNENNKLTKILSAIFLDMNEIWDLLTFQSNNLRKFDGTIYSLMSGLNSGSFKFRGGKFQSPINTDFRGAKIRGEQINVKLSTNSNQYRELLESYITYRKSKINN